MSLLTNEILGVQFSEPQSPYPTLRVSQESKDRVPRYTLPSTVGALNHDPTRTRAPAFSFGVRTRVSSVQSSSPGPKYNTRGVNEHGRLQSQQTSLSGREKTKFIHTPGPKSYNAQITEAKAPCYSFGMRKPNRSKEKIGPGPNKYELPACIGPKIPYMKSVPAYSILSRNFLYIKQHQTPGPKYLLPAPIIYLKKPPQVSLLGRCKQKYNNGIPGPNKL
ncbi:outer dense fiber protein 3-like [Homalodisca vitripennis]|uniref:outer dense fiber protein 3-like n=1 Tax=Homalodisca vitripennis TaxID=197043 RepID=UPI001EEAB367|nr:outer dense fiber protein 3-like [Homalodisca vitripennis]